jgi:N-methylhydantoinase B
MCGGWGARPDRDGIDGASALAANLANVPVEEIELNQPVRVRRYGFVPDTGGPGRWRGCLSVVRELELRDRAGLLQVRSDRRRFLPYGLAGGHQGTPSANVLDPDGEARLLPTNTTCEIGPGTVFRHTTAGGGGHGDPSERAVEDVLADVLDEKLTPAYALRVYGVAVDVARGTAERVG